jgi:N-acetylglucosamine kinase-like BadF-type ATPase
VTGVILAVDGGNSKTDVVLCSADGELLAAARGPTTSHQAVGLEAGLDRLAALVAAAPGPPADLALCCLAGLDLASDEARLQPAYAARAFARETLLFNDTIAALRAGTPEGWGVAVICGSGVNAAGRAPDGRLARFAGLGEIAGDRGGGSGLGMWGLGAAVRAVDGRGPATSLSTLVPAFFGLDEPAAVTEAMYLGRIDQDRVGELAPVVAQAARDGDAVAAELVDDVADELASFATAAIRRLGLEGEAVPITLAGGLARGAADLLVPRVATLVREIAPAADVTVLHAPPVLGAALLGLDRLAPGDHAAADRLRAAIIAWDANLGARPAGS